MDYEERYQRLRNLVLGHTPETLGMSPTGDRTAVYGAAVEQNEGSFTFLISGFSSGDASVYTDGSIGVMVAYSTIVFAKPHGSLWVRRNP
jgi:hypothetical protein